MKFTLLTRSYCSLCTQMADALAPLQTRYGFSVESIDVDDFPELLARYDEYVPVLLDENGGEICHWHLDEAALHASFAPPPENIRNLNDQP